MPEETKPSNESETPQSHTFKEELDEVRKKGTYIGALIAALIVGLPSVGTSISAFLNASEIAVNDSQARAPIIEGLLVDIELCRDWSGELEARLISLERMAYGGDPSIARVFSDDIEVELPHLQSHMALHELSRKVALAKGIPLSALRSPEEHLIARALPNTDPPPMFDMGVPSFDRPAGKPPMAGRGPASVDDEFDSQPDASPDEQPEASAMTPIEPPSMLSSFPEPSRKPARKVPAEVQEQLKLPSIQEVDKAF